MEDFFEEVHLRPEGLVSSQMKSWAEGKHSRQSMCKGPEAGKGLMYLRNRKIREAEVV